MSLKLPFRRQVIFFSTLRNLREGGYNIVFVHNIGSFSSFLIPLINFFCESKIILKADFNKQTYLHAKRNWFYKKLVMLPTNSSDIITCFTKGEKDLLISLGVPHFKIVFIPVIMDIKKVPVLTNSPNSPAGKCTIGILGRISHEKGFHRIISPMQKILKNFPGSKFIVGGPKSDKRYAEEFLNSFKNHKGFSYKGFINKVFDDFMNYCDIILVPSLLEGCSITCVEAMAAGKAVIASDIHPHNEYIKSGKNGYLAKLENDYYRLCKHLLMNPSEIKKLGKAARRSVKKNGRVGTDGKDVEKIYKMIG
jgi:glycosyltransferase involved in cell wall biosynthesis